MSEPNQKNQGGTTENRQTSADQPNGQEEKSSERNNDTQPPPVPLTSFGQGVAPVNATGQPNMGSGNGPGDDNSSPDSTRIAELEEQLRQSSQEIEKLKEIKAKYDNLTQQNVHRNPTQFLAWWQKLYGTLRDNFQRTEKATYELKEHDKVRKYPGSIINLLYQLQSDLNSERKQWNDWFTGRDATIQNLEKQIQSLRTKLGDKEDRIRNLEKIEADYSSIKKENDDLNSRYNRVLTEITALKTGGAGAPQHEVLHTAFKELKDQGFKEISNKIFKLRSQCDPDAKVERKLETAKIRSKLAEAVLMGMVEISKEGNITEREITKLSKSVLGKFVMYFVGCGCRDIETKFPTEAKEVEESIKRIAKRALKLVNDIVHASPPGTLLWYEKEEGVEFNPEEHEVLLGCAEWGKIEFTVYPGYAVYEGDAKRRRIFEKATVFTALEKRT